MFKNIQDRYLFDYEPAKIRLYGNLMLVIAILICLAPAESKISLITPCFLLFLGCYDLKLAYEIHSKQKKALIKKYSRHQNALKPKN